MIEMHDSLVYSNPPPMVCVKGTHREIGRQLGEALRPQILHSLDNARALVGSSREQLQLDWSGAIIQARKYMPFTQERYPQYIEEIIGMAEGANISYEDLATLNAMEAVTVDALHLTKCTSLAVNQKLSANEHVLVAHNEDWLPEDEPDVCVVHASPNDEPPWLGMTYGGLLSNIGFNACGIAQTCDSVYPTDIRIGIPRIIVSRAVLGARRLDEAIRATLVPLRAAGYNHLIADANGELYNIEVSARRFAMLYGGDDGYIGHTNHYLSPNMKEIEDEPDELISTRIRYHRALRLLKESAPHTVESLQSILRDHVNFPDSICNHAMDEVNPLDREKTINSLVIDLDARKMYLAWGNPCRNVYHPFELNA